MRSPASSARRARAASHGTVAPAESAVVARAVTAGAAPLTKQRTTGRPVSSTVELKVAISL